MMFPRVLGVAASALLSTALVAADAPPAPVESPVFEQMHRLFALRLKADVGLDDTQIEKVLPRIDALERSRVEAGLGRRALVRQLRHGLAEGMTDAELQRRLEALDRIGQETESLARATLQEVDRDLTVPQRVRLRFLMVRFRNEMSHRIETFSRTGDPRRHRRAEPPSEPAP